MFSQVLPFWNADVHALSFAIEESRWIREVLPGLGYDQLRLIEVALPPPLPGHASAAGEWDKARRAFDERRYADCVSECRDLLAMWNKQFAATKAAPLAIRLGDQAGWAADDGRRTFVDGLWKSTMDIVNAPHHPEGQPVEQRFDRADARLVLMMTATLCEYLGAQS